MLRSGFFWGILGNLVAALIGFIVGVSPKIFRYSKDLWAKRKFRRLFTAYTRLINSRDPNANWDVEARGICEKHLDSLKIKYQSSPLDTRDELWLELKGAGNKAVNLILLGSPVRLQIAQDFLLDFELRFGGGKVILVKSEVPCSPMQKSIADISSIDGFRPVPKDNKQIHPVTLERHSEGSFPNLVWPGIRIERGEIPEMFPKYPFEASLKGATFRGYEHAIVIVVNGQIQLEGQPGGLSIARIVMLMGYSGPSTLAAADAFFNDPALFEPKKRPGAMLSVLEVPVVCDTTSANDSRYVPANSIRLVWRRIPDDSDVPLKAPRLPYQFPHQCLKLSDAPKGPTNQNHTSNKLGA